MERLRPPSGPHRLGEQTSLSERRHPCGPSDTSEQPKTALCRICDIKLSGCLQSLAPLFLAVLFCGCGRSEPQADLVVVNGAEPESLDPAIITGQPDIRAVLPIFEGLTR